MNLSFTVTSIKFLKMKISIFNELPVVNSFIATPNMKGLIDDYILGIYLENINIE